MEATGVTFEPGPTATFEILQAMYAAAMEGLGIGLASSPTVLPHLGSGRLRPLSLPSARLDGGYRLAAHPGARRRPAIEAVWAWLVAEARATPTEGIGGA
jgi:DNA-binding transcriptional LysR family regulator